MFFYLSHESHVLKKNSFSKQGVFAINKVNEHDCKSNEGIFLEFSNYLKYVNSQILGVSSKYV